MKEEYEYTNTTELSGDASFYFMIPSELLNRVLYKNDENAYLLPVFAYFSIKRGLDNTITFNINQIVNWMNRIPNRNRTGINNRVKECIKILEECNYLSINNPLTNASLNVAVFNTKKVKQECDGHRFSVLYLDELEKIFAYTNEDTRKVRFIQQSALRVFLYLKTLTFKRPNKLSIEERTGNVEEDVRKRREISPEAFDAYYCQIAQDMELSTKIVSEAVKALFDIGLLYYEELPRYIYHGNWRTDHTIFAFTYKREKNYLLASGESYYLAEVKRKKAKLMCYRKKIQ